MSRASTICLSDRMAGELKACIPNAKSISVHTGNIVNWNRANRTLTQPPKKELTECVSSVIGKWLKETDNSLIQNTTELICLNKTYLEKLSAEERSELKLTVKIFLSDLRSEALDEAISAVLCELGVATIETVLLSLPLSQITMDNVRPLWEKLEQWVAKEQVFSLGVSDFSKAMLEELYDWAKVKPCIDQVNLDVCCVIPPELSEYTKEKEIQLLTHNDPAEILPEEDLKAVLSDHFQADDVKTWQPYWVARYSVLIQCRGVVKTKGYITKAKRAVEGQ